MALSHYADVCYDRDIRFKFYAFPCSSNVKTLKTRQVSETFNLCYNEQYMFYIATARTWWDKCPGLCTCPTLEAICPGQAFMSNPDIYIYIYIYIYIHKKNNDQPQYRERISPQEALGVTAEKHSR